MPLVSNKHSNAERVFYSSFDGGLNLSMPPESLAKNELSEALNVEFSPLKGVMQVRGGLVWSGRFPDEVKSVVAVPGKLAFLVSVKNSRKLYFFKWNNVWEVDGTLTGNNNLSAVTWGESGEMLIASGGKLQKFSGLELPPKLETISNSPDNCKLVFVREGRACVVNGADIITFSAVGDCESWNNDPEDSSTGQFVEIGYKDGMNIDAVIPLSRDLIIFKSPVAEPDKGTVFRLTGDFPDWQVLEVAHNTGTYSQLTAKAIANDVFYITKSGLATLSSVNAYGDIQTSWPDRKVSVTLTQKLSQTAKLWDVPVKQQLWLLPSEQDKTIWVFDYTRGIWTCFEFPEIISHAVGVKNELYVFIGRDLYHVQDGYTQDDMKDTGKKEIYARLKLGTLLKAWEILIKGAFATFYTVPSCEAVLKLDNFKMPFKAGGSVDYIYDAPNDTQYAFDDNDLLFPEGGILTSRRRFIVRNWEITPIIEITGGGCSLSTLGLEISEV